MALTQGGGCCFLLGAVQPPRPPGWVRGPSRVPGRGSWRVGVISALLSLFTGAFAFDPTPVVEVRYYLATLAPGADRAEATALFESAHLHSVEWLRPLPVYRLGIAGGPEGQAEEARLRSSSLLRALDPDGQQQAQTVPNDPFYPDFQWNLRKIGAEEAWNLRPSAPDVMVAVLDTGVDLNHPDLRPNLLVDRGYDFIHDLPGAQDDSSHGTAVAGVIGAVGNNRIGLTGVAWNVRILPVKVLDRFGTGPDSALIKGINYAVSQGARIINISSTGVALVAATEEALAYAQAQGILVVAAAGNTGDAGNAVTYPAAYPGVLAVGAVDEDGRVAPFSQRRPYVGLVAPGVDVASTAWPGAGSGPYGSQSGTSIAAPHASGVAALLMALRPDLAAAEIARLLKTTAVVLDQPGANGASGAGLLSAARAVAAIRPGVPPRDAARPEPAPSPPPLPAPLPVAPSRWYFAEGSTKLPFDTSFSVYNASSRLATIRFTFLSPAGTSVQSNLSVAVNGRATVAASGIVPNADFATIVEADVPVFVERSMYFGHDGHSSRGVRAPSRSWQLAEGSTAAPFDTWILISNPNPVATTARLTFLKEDGAQIEHQQAVPPMGRASVYVNALPVTGGFSTQVAADQPIVVERAMYFDGGMGGHDTVATPSPARTWYLAGGTSRQGFDTWLLLENPGPSPATIRVSLITETGAVAVQPMLVAPHARASLYTNAVVSDVSFGIRVEADQPVVSEGAVYFDSGRAGYALGAVPDASAEWYLADGSTAGSFVEQLAILNTSVQTATIQLNFQRQDGSTVPSQVRVVPASSQLILDVNPYVPDANVAIQVVASRPVVVQRTSFFAGPEGRGATSSPGYPR